MVINKETIEEISLWFCGNCSLSTLLQSYNVILENGYGTFFLQSKTDKDVKFYVDSKERNLDKFNSVTFYEADCKALTIQQLKEMYSLYSTAFIPYDDERVFAFESKKKYRVIVYVNGMFNQETDAMIEGKLLRVSISWD